MFDKNKYFIKLENNDSDGYDNKYMKIKTNADHTLNFGKKFKCTRLRYLLDTNFSQMNIAKRTMLILIVYYYQISILFF